MGKCFSHLSLSDRRVIEALLNQKVKPQKIADQLHVHVSTIYREVNRCKMVQRNSDLTEEERYNPDGAEKRYRENLKAKGAQLKIGNDIKFAEYIESKVVDEGYSPAAALASIETEGKKFSTSICTSTFYSYIEKGVFLRLTNANLPEKSKRKKAYKRVKTVKRPPRGESIENRPPEVDTRETLGHWEMDTVYSQKKSSKDTLLVLTERMSRNEIVEKLPDRTSESVVKALDRIERRYGALFPKIFLTITVDNGSEFSDVERLEQSAIRKGQKRTKIYFCHPYCSQERGTNENQNRMIRRKYPKGTDFGKVKAKEIKEHEAWMNNYPRKILGWRTSKQVFDEQVSKLTEKGK